MWNLDVLGREGWKVEMHMSEGWGPITGGSLVAKTSGEKWFRESILAAYAFMGFGKCGLCEEVEGWNGWSRGLMASHDARRGSW